MDPEAVYVAETKTLDFGLGPLSFLENPGLHFVMS